MGTGSFAFFLLPYRRLIPRKNAIFVPDESADGQRENGHKAVGDGHAFRRERLTRKDDEDIHGIDISDDYGLPAERSDAVRAGQEEFRQESEAQEAADDSHLGSPGDIPAGVPCTRDGGQAASGGVARPGWGMVSVGIRDGVFSGVHGGTVLSDRPAAVMAFQTKEEAAADGMDRRAAGGAYTGGPCDGGCNEAQHKGKGGHHRVRPRPGKFRRDEDSTNH